MTLAIKVFGIKEALETFGDLPRSIQNKHMRIGLSAGAGIIRDAAVANVPKSSGLLAKSMKVRVKVPDASFNKAHHGRPAYAVIGPARRVEGRVGIVRGRVKTITTRQAIKRSFGGGGFTIRRPSRYAHLVERGTTPHIITAKNARVLASNGNVFGRMVGHPGSAGKKFLSSAVRSSGAQAQRRVIDKLQQGITEWSAQRAAKAYHAALTA
jgi:HK97 gp10 family phage protein